MKNPQLRGPNVKGRSEDLQRKARPPSAGTPKNLFCYNIHIQQINTARFYVYTN